MLYWVVKGKTNKDIGEILGSSPATAKKHLERVYVKLGVETRTAAAAWPSSASASCSRSSRGERSGWRPASAGQPPRNAGTTSTWPATSSTQCRHRRTRCHDAAQGA